MDSQIDLITLIALAVAVVAVLRLWSVLGRRTNDDDSRLERLRTRQRQEAEARAGGKIVTLPRREREDAAGPQTPPVTAAEAEAKIKTFAAGDAKVEEDLSTLLRHDPAFDPEHFIRGAKHAYEMIVTAFADGNTKALSDLLSPEVYDNFSRAIEERNRRGERVDQKFVGIEKAEVLNARVEKGIAEITVRFVSQLIKATRNRSGAVIDGDETRVVEVTDIWTFNRNISTARARENPNWLLVETQSQG